MRIVQRETVTAQTGGITGSQPERVVQVREARAGDACSKDGLPARLYKHRRLARRRHSRKEQAVKIVASAFVIALAVASAALAEDTTIPGMDNMPMGQMPKTANPPV